MQSKEFLVQYFFHLEIKYFFRTILIFLYEEVPLGSRQECMFRLSDGKDSNLPMLEGIDASMKSIRLNNNAMTILE